MDRDCTNNFHTMITYYLLKVKVCLLTKMKMGAKKVSFLFANHTLRR